MAANLVSVIFNQFLSIVEKLSKKSCCVFNECDFDYRVRDLGTHRLIDVMYVIEDKCGRRQDVIATIDYTNICFEDLSSPQWKEYLTKIAIEFINYICPKKYELIDYYKRKCRQEPPRWEPLPCNNVTTIIKKHEYVEPEPECEVIIENECKCVPFCKRTTCGAPKQHIIVKYVTEKPWKCGDVTRVVRDTENQHDFAQYRGHPDFNNHKWKSCCGSN